jgi:membrane-associated phospholipid phosphatase
MKSFIAILFSLFIAGSSGCGKKHNPEELNQFSRTLLIDCNRKLTDIIISDIFTPPVASRIYAYANIAAYESLVAGDSNFVSLNGQLHGWTDIPQPDPGKTYYYPVAAMFAFYTVSERLVFAEKLVAEAREQCLTKIKSIGIDEEVLRNSINYGKTVGEHTLAWAKTDGYIKRQSMPRYILLKKPGAWQPTPPDYVQAIEPNWRTLRPFIMDSAAQFKPARPTTFDTIPGSAFYEEAMEVYRAVQDKDAYKLEIGKFWDCNPNISYTKGHVTFFHQKISPGGHWLSIASIVAKMKNLDMMQTSEAFVRTSVALADAFISCWDEKYRSSLIRPETYIEKYIDPTWAPLLQTPPFPEYPSGHSVISGAAATVLTDLFGEAVAYTDTTEVRFGMPARQFTSFFQAADEAAISRLYGGIHFRPAIENGSKQGRAVGAYVVNKLRTRKNQTPKQQLAKATFPRS